MNRDEVKELRSALDKVLEGSEVAKKYKIELGSCRFNSGNATFKLIVSSLSSTGDALVPMVTDFKNRCNEFGVKRTALGAKFTVADGTVYTLVGLEPRKHKFPFIALNPAGQRYKFPVSAIKAYLSKDLLFDADFHSAQFTSLPSQVH